MQATTEKAIQLYDSTYDEKTDFVERKLFAPMRAVLAANAGHIHGVAVDLATSTGKGLSLYKGKDCKVFGVDLSPPALHSAKLRATFMGIDFNPTVANVATIPLPANTADVVSCQLGFCTFEDPEAVVREVLRVAKKDASVLLLEHQKPSNLLGRAFVRLIAPMAQKKLGCDPTRDTLGMFKRAGFSVESYHPRLGGMIHATVLRVPRK